MTAEEFLLNKWKSCILIKDNEFPENIVMVYDKQHERKLKLNSLKNSNEEIKYIKNNDSIVLFYQDHKTGYLRINYDEIWSVLYSKYNIDVTYNLIRNILLIDDKLKQLMPTSFHIIYKPLYQKTNKK